MVLDHEHPLDLQRLYDQQIQSLIVEGGAKTLQSFIDQNLWDEIRVETSPLQVDDGTPAPSIPSDAIITDCQEFDGNKITWWRNY
jgi:diaminohydroxyphosphoribosylaminopyrimidine deaminase/5-amino-6-(5-phosphoribosylamino)uracil reductase